MAQSIPPSLRGIPFLGNLKNLADDPLMFLSSLGQTYGSISTFRLGSRLMYFINDPDYIQQVLQSNQFIRSKITRKMLKSFLGEGVFYQEGETHRQQRRLMQPAFHRERMSLYAQIMSDQTALMVDRWHDGESRDMVADMMQLTLEIVAQSLFGSSTSAEAQQIGEAFHLVQATIDNEYEVYSILPDWMPVIRFGKYQRAVSTVQIITDQIIRSRRKVNRDQGDLLTMLLTAQDEDGSRMTDEQVNAQVLSMLFAGHETTANTMAWTWYLLSNNPHAYEKLTAEIDQVLQGQQPTMADLPRLKYTEMVIKESQRLYPSAWYAERVPLNDTTLGEYPVKAGTPVVISVYVTQRDARFFDRPEEFIPERFSEENVGRIPKYAYMPFGAGAHQCIGNGFAMMATRLILATVVQRYHLQVEDGYVPRPRSVVTMGISNKLPVRLTQREPVAAV